LTELKTRITTGKRSKDCVKPKIQAALDAGNIQEVIDNLTERQRRFVEEYLVDYNGAAAVKRAGYNTKYEARLATEMLSHPGIRAAIDKMTIQRADKAIIKPDYVMKKLQRTIEKAEVDGNHTAVLRGCEILARALGMFVERREISGPNGDAIQYKQVQEAADAFTSAIAGLIERGGESNVIDFPRSESQSAA
jgi:phage terminase small subunit